jgi:hypothetical protein
MHHKKPKVSDSKNAASRKARFTYSETWTTGEISVSRLGTSYLRKETYARRCRIGGNRELLGTITNRTPTLALHAKINFIKMQQQ